MHLSIAAQPSSSPSAVPSSTTGPTSSAARLCLWHRLTGATRPGSKRGSIRTGLGSPSWACKRSLENLRRLDPLRTSAELRPNFVEKVVEVCRQDASGLVHRCVRPGQQKGDSERCVGQVLGRHLDDEVVNLSVRLFLGESVDEGEREWL